MVRALAVVLVALTMSGASAQQAQTVLHITVTLLDAAGKPTPVPRHALLISDNPSTAEPRLVTTGADGTVNVRLRPGNYTVESDAPVSFRGKAYHWTQTLDVPAGRESVLELSIKNAEVAAATDAASGDVDPSTMLMRWQTGVVALWTPTAHASGVFVDANGAKGLIATNQRVVGTALSVTVQLTPMVSVIGRVLASDPARDVAVVWIDSNAAPTVQAVPIGCASGETVDVKTGEKVIAIGTALHEPIGASSGTVRDADQQSISADFGLGRGATGGPVFNAQQRLVGITSEVGEDGSRRGDARIVRVSEVCEVVAAAARQTANAQPPSGTHLPVDPQRSFPMAALTDAAQHRAGSLNPYRMSSADFDIAFITPVMTFGVGYQAEQMQQRARGRGRGTAEPVLVRPVMDFRNWSDYVQDIPAVLLIRVTPKLVENFWTTVARGAAQTQGIAVPAIKHAKWGFARMRVFCGDAEVTPIHPFLLEQRITESDTIVEGLYAFDADAIGPHCGPVKLTLFADKPQDKPDKSDTSDRGDTRVVDGKIVEQVWQDFAAYRASK